MFRKVLGDFGVFAALLVARPGHFVRSNVPVQERAACGASFLQPGVR